MGLTDKDFASELCRQLVARDDEIRQLREEVEKFRLHQKYAADRGYASSEQPNSENIELDIRSSVTLEAEPQSELARLRAEVQQIPRLRATLKMAEMQLLDKEERCASVRQEYEEVTKKLECAYEGSSMFESRIRDLATKLSEAQSRLEQRESSDYQANPQRMLELMTERDQMQLQLEEANKQIQNDNSRLQQLEMDKTHLAQSLLGLEGQLRNRSQQIAESQRELDAAKSRELELAAKCASLQSQMRNLRKELEAHKAFTSNRLEIAHAPSQSAILQPTPTAVQQSLTVPEGQPLTQTLSSQPLIIKLPPPATPRLTHSLPQRASGEPSEVFIQTNSMSEPRRAVLDKLPAIEVPESAMGDITFNRSELTAALGGGLQGVDGRFGKPRHVAAVHGLTGCIYPQRQTNPWLPTRPGEHGYMFLGLEGPAKDHLKFFEPTERALFILDGKSGWRYYGLYIVQRHAGNELSSEEWQAFDESFKEGRDGYSDTTLMKRLGKSGYEALAKGHVVQYRHDMQQIRAEYDAGIRRVPCITLQCIGYNEQLLQDILACRQSEPSSTGKRKRQPRARPDKSRTPTRPRLDSE